MTVCTGNICRSPMAEVLLRAALVGTGIRVHSAGTHALVDEAMTPQALQLALSNGADASGADAHRARLLTEPLLAETDLVLTMAREHRSAVVQMAPALLHRTFTVREFARLAATLETTRCGAAWPPTAPTRGRACGPSRGSSGGNEGLWPLVPTTTTSSTLTADPRRRTTCRPRSSCLLSPRPRG